MTVPVAGEGTEERRKLRRDYKIESTDLGSCWRRPPRAPQLLMPLKIQRVGLGAGPFCFGVLIRGCLLPGAAFRLPRLRRCASPANVRGRSTATTDSLISALCMRMDEVRRAATRAKHVKVGRRKPGTRSSPMVITAIISRFLEG